MVPLRRALDYYLAPTSPYILSKPVVSSRWTSTPNNLAVSSISLLSSVAYGCGGRRWHTGVPQLYSTAIAYRCPLIVAVFRATPNQHLFLYMPLEYNTSMFCPIQAIQIPPSSKAYTLSNWHRKGTRPGGSRRCSRAAYGNFASFLAYLFRLVSLSSVILSSCMRPE